MAAASCENNLVFIEIFEMLDNELSVETKYIRILPNGSVVCGFVKKACHDVLTGHLICPSSEEDKNKLAEDYANLWEFKLRNYGIKVGVEEGVIVLTYRPSNREDLPAIRRYIETISNTGSDSEEYMKARKANPSSFCYD